MKIVTVVGARPQFVKAAAVSRAITEWNRIHPARQLGEMLVHTGQHYDENMSKVFFDEMSIPAPYKNLEVGSGSHAYQTAMMMIGLEDLFIETSPDMAVVYGDTNSTLSAAIVAAKLDIPLAHVEAGMRSFNRSMPEELNRVVTDHLSSLLFCSSATSAENLFREGIGPDSPGRQSIIISGDVMIDCLHFYASAQTRHPAVVPSNGRKPILLTVHRAENTTSVTALRSILDVLANTGRPVVFPVHPRTRALLTASKEPLPSQIECIEPVGYLRMLEFEQSCAFICTDSGGVQKEAFFLKKPCITLRTETEWTETVSLGWNKIVGTSVVQLGQAVMEAEEFLTSSREAPFELGSYGPADPYGSGQASQKIVEEIWNFGNQVRSTKGRRSN